MKEISRQKGLVLLDLDEDEYQSLENYRQHLSAYLDKEVTRSYAFADMVRRMKEVIEDEKDCGGNPC